eukprot:jgi/Ulvmu1/3464/UM016_0084.1
MYVDVDGGAACVRAAASAVNATVAAAAAVDVAPAAAAVTASIAASSDGKVPAAGAGLPSGAPAAQGLRRSQVLPLACYAWGRVRVRSARNPPPPGAPCGSAVVCVCVGHFSNKLAAARRAYAAQVERLLWKLQLLPPMHATTQAALHGQLRPARAQSQNRDINHAISFHHPSACSDAGLHLQVFPR